jgi:hypothetical protein
MSAVMSALVAGIHVLILRPFKTWMAGTSPAMMVDALALLNGYALGRSVPLTNMR